MASSELSIVIVAQDKASPVFKSLGDSLKGTFKTGLMVATGGLAAFTAGLGFAVSEAIDAEEIQNKLASVLKSTGGIAGVTADEVNKLAGDLSKLTKFSDDQIVSAETMLLTFTNIGEKVFPQATETVLNMAEMFGSADQAAIQLGKALNDPIEGVGALKRVGVTFTKQQEEMIKGFVESGQLAKAQGVILTELEKEFGGVAKAAGKGLGGQLTILKNQFFDVFEGIGMRFLPALTAIVTGINAEVVPALNNFIDTIAPFVESVVWPFDRLFKNIQAGTDISTAFNLLIQDMTQTFQWFLEQLGLTDEQIFKFSKTFFDLAHTVKDFAEGTLIPFVKEHMEGFKAAFIAIGAVLTGSAIIGGILTIGAAIAALVNPFTLVIGAIALFAAAWTEDWGGIRTYFMDNIWPALKITLEQLRIWLAEYVPQAIDALKAYWNDVLLPSLFLLKLFWQNTLKPALNDLGEWLKTHIPIAIDALKTYWETVLLPALDKLKQFWDNTLEPLFEDFSEWLITNIPNAMQDLSDAWTNILKPGLEGISNFWYQTLLPAFLDIEAWLKVYLPIAVGNVKGVFDGLASTFWNVWGAVQSLKGNLDGLMGKLNTIQLPGFLQRGSPSPLEMTLTGAVAGVRDLNAAFSDLGRGGMMGGDMNSGVNRTTHNNFNLTVQTNGSDERVMSDFGMMKTWAGA